MGKRERRDRAFSLEQSGAMVLLSVLFLLGGVLGCFFSRFLISIESESLVAYLVDYMLLAQEGQIKRKLWNIVWNELRYVLLIVLFGMTPIKRVGVPLVLFLRGFFLSFSIGCLIQSFGTDGILLGTFFFLVPALCWGPALFLAAYRVISMDASYLGEKFWSTVGLCGVLLASCISVEFWVVPTLLRIMARVVL